MGSRLIEAALLARARSQLLSNVPWRILVGHNLDEAQFERFRLGAPDGVIVERNRPDFGTLLSRTQVSVSQVGYNTVIDLLKARSRAVVVPFASATQTEQRLRAALLDAGGLAYALLPEELTPGALAGAIDTTLARPRPSSTVDLNGATRAAQILWELAGGKMATPWALR
ncbi:MAG: hypothetical protein HOI95_30470 [Chromatiales bacterium]|nr:hypothetical protein [Chromatiales bacterium]